MVTRLILRVNHVESFFKWTRTLNIQFSIFNIQSLRRFNHRPRLDAVGADYHFLNAAIVNRPYPFQIRIESALG